ncbi:phage portal protein, partial [Candidatus Pacearchaeota archaeon]|nr:phage portal protein [Candidatus Pacearchaeota archaeon]
EPLVRVKWGTGKRGSVVRCTPNHPILTPSGYVESSKLKVGDEVMAAGPVLTKEQEQVLLGTLLGDAHFKVSKTSGGYPSIAFCHSKKQEDYFDWKVNAINTLGRWVIERESVSRIGNRHKKKIFQSNKHVMLSRIADIIDHRDGKKHINRTWLDAIGAIGLAVWAMDDGSMQLHKTKMRDGKLWDGPGRFIFCTDRYSREECEIIKEWLSFTWDIQSSILCPPSTGKCRVRLTVDGTRKFRKIVYPYLVVDGTTKIWKAPSIATGKPCGASPVRIIEIDSIAKKASVYDIEVRQNHNFLVNGVIVHNSRLEISLDLTTTLLYAWTYNKELFKTNYPENILTVAGDFDKQGLDSFKQHILGEAGGPKNNWRLPVISTGSGAEATNFKVESHKLRESPKDMLFDELFRFMIMFKCAAYGAHPSVLNFSSDQGTGSHLGTHNPVNEIAESKEHGLKPSLLDLCEWWTQDLIKPRYDDLKLILTGLDNEDEKEVIELRDKRVKGWISKNEARMEEGLKPIGNMDDPKNPWNFPADAPMSTYLSTMDMLGGGEGGEGADNGEGGMFDGFDDNGNETEDGGLFEGGKQQGKKVAERKPTESLDDKIEKSQRKTKFLKIMLKD